MTPAQGRVIFFDALAGALQQSFLGELPKRTAIVFSNPSDIPADDRVSLAHAVCRLRDHTLDPILTVEIASKVRPTTFNEAMVVDAYHSPADGELDVLLDDPGAPPIIVFILSHAYSGARVVPVPCDLGKQHSLSQRATDALFRAAGRPTDPLASSRFRRHGFKAFFSFDLFDKPVDRDWSNPDELEANASLLGESWIFRGEPVSGEAIASWLFQFREAGFVEEAISLLRYLRRDGYLTKNRIVGNIMRSYDRFVADLGERPSAISFQPVGKSELMLAYDLIAIRFSDAEEVLLRAENSGSLVHIVCVDDFVGSGKTMTRAIFEGPHAKRLVPLFERKKIRFTALVSHADLRGIRAVCDHPCAHGVVSVQSEQIVDGSHRVFDAQSVVIQDRVRRDAFRDFCCKVGRDIYPRHPLGWNDAQWCIVAEYTIPNTSLPVFFASGKGRSGWKPLFPRERLRAK